jgi:DNA-binding response OmpR family regulator
LQDETYRSFPPRGWPANRAIASRHIVEDVRAEGECRMRILIVEDNALLAFMIEDALIEAGHEIFGPVGTPAEAMALAEQSRPQLVIVDVNLKNGTSGVEVARYLHINSDVPSLFATGQVEIAWQNSDVAIGVLAKPFSPDTVVKVVAAISRILSGQDASEVPAEFEMFDPARRGGTAG